MFVAIISNVFLFSTALYDFPVTVRQSMRNKSSCVLVFHLSVGSNLNRLARTVKRKRELGVSSILTKEDKYPYTDMYL